MAPSRIHSLFLFIGLLHRGLHAGDSAIVTAMQQDLKKYTRQAIAHSKRIEDMIVAQVAYKLEERFTEDNLDLHMQKEWELASKKEHLYIAPILLQSLNPNRNSCDIETSCKAIKKFVSDTLATCERNELEPELITHHIGKIETQYSIQNTHIPAIIFLHQINSSVCGFSVSFEFDPFYKLIYLITPEFNNLMLLLKKKDPLTIEPDVR